MRYVCKDVHYRDASISVAAYILVTQMRAWDSCMIHMLFRLGASEHGGVLV